MIAFIKSTRTLLALFGISFLLLGSLYAQEDYYEEPDPPTIEEKIPTSPSIKGASPENGANNLIRNAFVSARMDLLDRYQGVDAKSVSEKSIRLYPSKNPEKPVDVYITVNNGLKNILLEPEDVLEPNTEYVFEINSNLVDLEGIPFENYRSSFKTGTVELPKRINKNKPRVKVIAAKKRIKLNALPEGYLLKKKKPKEEVAPPPAIAEKKAVEPEKPEFDPNLTPQQLKKAKLEAAIAAKLAKYNAKKEEPAPVPVPVPQKVETKAPDVKVETVAEKESTQVPSGKIAEAAVKESKVKEAAKKPEVLEEPKVLKEEKKVLPQKLSINYKVNVVRRDKPLPVSFAMPKQMQIRYMIKNSSGVIVKKGSGIVDAGNITKTIPTKNLEPGAYKIAIKVGDKVQNHSFTILK